MQATDGRLVLSPSDLNDYVECPHLITLASSADDVPRGLEFLFSRNRLNVAVSRAMCLACVVASPRLLESRARTIEQMRLINALCRFAELADRH